MGGDNYHFSDGDRRLLIGAAICTGMVLTVALILFIIYRVLKLCGVFKGKKDKKTKESYSVADQEVKIGLREETID